MEERTGTANSLFLQGTAGDINPKDNGEYITGEKLANEVISVLNKPMTKIEGPTVILYSIQLIFPSSPGQKKKSVHSGNRIQAKPAMYMPRKT